MSWCVSRGGSCLTCTSLSRELMLLWVSNWANDPGIQSDRAHQVTYPLCTWWPDRKLNRICPLLENRREENPYNKRAAPRSQISSASQACRQDEKVTQKVLTKAGVQPGYSTPPSVPEDLDLILRDHSPKSFTNSPDIIMEPTQSGNTNSVCLVFAGFGFDIQWEREHEHSLTAWHFSCRQCWAQDIFKPQYS